MTGPRSDRWKWLTSLGGPLVVVPAGLPWAGCPNPGDPLDPTHDYGRACAVKGYAGLVRAGSGRALVLNDMPMPTAWVPTEVGGWLVRWMYAPDESAVLSAVAGRSAPEQ